MRYILNLIFISLLTAVISCDFDPNGENYVELPRPSTSGMSIELTDIDNDTISIFAYTEISYRSIIGNKKVKYFEAFINNASTWTQANSAGTFYINPQLYEDGFYSLRIDINTFSGTGSLADVRDRETLNVSKTYVLEIDRSKPDPGVITSIEKIDGTLEVKWARYSKSNFQKYYLTKYAYNQGFNYYELHWIKEITDQNVTSLLDSTFIGGKVKYSLIIEAALQQSDYVEKEFELPYDLNLSSEWLDKTQIKFTWRKTPFYENFSAYKIQLSDQREFTFNHVDDTTFTLNAEILFPEVKNATVIAYPYRIDTYHSEYVYGNTFFSMGKEFPNFMDDKITFNIPLNKYFAIRQTYNIFELVRINSSTFEVEQTREVNGSQFVISDNGQYLYTTSGDMLTRLNPTDFSIINTYDLSTLNGSNGNDWAISLSNTNRMAMVNYSGNFVLNMDNFTILQQWPYATERSIKISPEGGYIVKDGKILKWNSVQYVETGTYNKDIMKALFKGDSKLMLSRVGAIDVIDLPSMTVERSIPTPAFYVSYDAVSSLLGGTTDEFASEPKKFYLHRSEDDMLIGEFNVASKVLFINNSLIANGRIVPLTQFYP